MQHVQEDFLLDLGLTRRIVEQHGQRDLSVEKY